MAPHEIRRPFKRPAISDQQKRRDLALLRQAQHRRDAQLHARTLASSVLSLQSPDSPDPITHLPVPDPSTHLPVPGPGAHQPVSEPELDIDIASESDLQPQDLTVVQASKLRGSEARRWFARQLMLPEWMIDVPPRLNQDWYVFPRPAGKRCFVVSSNGTTVSRLRNGSILHHFPSALPNGARRKEVSGPAHVFCILDCIFHEQSDVGFRVTVLVVHAPDMQPDQTYYVIDMVCWRGYSLHDCSAEFRFFWLNSKLAETEACSPPSLYHRYRFSVVPIYECDQMGLNAAYTDAVPYGKDGLLLYNKHAHYQIGNTPLALVWKDENCSQYVLDTDSKGQVPSQQQVVLELQDDGKLTTSDDPPVVFGCLDGEFLQKCGLQTGMLLRFAITDGGLRIVDGKLEIADIHYVGKANRARAFADSYSKVLFQYTARRSPLKIEDLFASIHSSQDQESESIEVEMVT